MMLPSHTRILMLAIAVAGCQSKALVIGGAADSDASPSNPIPASDAGDDTGAPPPPSSCRAASGAAQPNDQPFPCGFDACNQCMCTNGRLVQTTFSSCVAARGDAGIDSGAAPVGQCNDLVAGGRFVTIVFKSGPPPDLGKGGPIVDGIYHLTESTIYQSAPTTDRFVERETIRISGGGKRIDYVTASDGFTMSETIAPVGASLNPTTTCPDSSHSFGPYYTATPGTFTLVNGLYVSVFTRGEPGSAPDAGADPITDAGADGPPPTSNTCGSLVGDGPTISTSQSAGSPPDPGQGGTLTDGVYDLTAMTYYNGAGGGGTLDSETIRISGGGTLLEYVSGFYNFGMVISMAPSGATLHDTVLCPVGEPSFNMFVGPNYTVTNDQVISIGRSYTKVFTRRVRDPILIP